MTNFFPKYLVVHIFSTSLCFIQRFNHSRFYTMFKIFVLYYVLNIVGFIQCLKQYVLNKDLLNIRLKLCFKHMFKTSCLKHRHPCSTPSTSVFPAKYFMVSLSQLGVGLHNCLKDRQPPKLSSTSKLIMNF